MKWIIEFLKRLKPSSLALSEYRFSDLKDAYREDIFVDEQIYEEIHQKKYRPIPYWLWVLRAYFRIITNPVCRIVAPLWCKAFGHDYISDDWAGPESGGMGWHCERCGDGEEHILY